MTTTPAPASSLDTRFLPGCRYYMRSPGDHDCVVTYEVVRRTACYVTLRHVRDGSETRCRVSDHNRGDGVERCHPWGVYSLCPTLSADRVAP